MTLCPRCKTHWPTAAFEDASHKWREGQGTGHSETVECHAIACPVCGVEIGHTCDDVMTRFAKMRIE